MTGKRPLPFPIWMVALDGVGTLLLGLGLFGLFGDVTLGSLAAADIQGLSIGLVVFGIILMLPLMTTLIRKILDGKGVR